MTLHKVVRCEKDFVVMEDMTTYLRKQYTTLDFNIKDLWCLAVGDVVTLSTSGSIMAVNDRSVWR